MAAHGKMEQLGGTLCIIDKETLYLVALSCYLGSYVGLNFKKTKQKLSPKTSNFGSTPQLDAPPTHVFLCISRWTQHGR